MENDTQTSRRWSRGRKLLAAVAGMALVGGAAYAALTWAQTRGTGTSDELQTQVLLSAVISQDTTAAATDTTVDGPLTPGLGSTTAVKVGNDFTVDVSSGYVGYIAPVRVEYLLPSSGSPVDMELSGVRIVQAGTDLPFSSGQAPVVAWSTVCSVLVNMNGGQTSTGAPVDLRLLHTDAFSGTDTWDVLVDFQPASPTDDAAHCTPETTTAAP